MLSRASEYLDSKNGIDKYKNKYECVLVDEYQDTNKVQLDIISHLCREHSQVTVVGDPNQSIYSWRGASGIFKSCLHKFVKGTNWKEFKSKFKNCDEVWLRNNYRSAQPIVSLCNSLIHLNGVKMELVSKKQVRIIIF
jgi:DNA helicase-2/ATP-dependent DNA helicase PcrA